MLFQQMFKNTYLCFLTSRLIIKTQLKIYIYQTTLNISMNYSISELIYHEALIFSLNFFTQNLLIFSFAISKVYYFLFFDVSEQFLNKTF